MIFVLAVLATWRITAYLVYENSAKPLRYKAGCHMLGDDDRPLTFWGRVLSCFWCTSLFVAVPLGGLCCLLENVVGMWILYWLSLSGGAILLNHLCRINLYAERR